MDVDLIKKFSPDDFDESTCDILERLGQTCYIKSILDLWGYSERKIRALTKQDILDKLNNNLQQ